MSLLEDRYRRVLRLLPESYRDEREDEMVDTYLESAGQASDEDGPRPSWSEIGSVVALAFRLRLGGAGAPPRFFAWGEAVRLVALLALLAQAVASVLSVWFTLRLHGVLGEPFAELGFDFDGMYGPPGSPTRTWYAAQFVLGLAWFPAFLALVYDRRRAAKVLVLLAALPPAVELIRGVIAASAGSLSWEDAWVHSAAQAVFAAVPVLALFAGFHRDAPAVRPRPWLVALAVSAVVLVALVQLVTFPIMLENPTTAGLVVVQLISDAGLYSTLLIAAGLVYTGVHVFAPHRRGPSLPLALAVLAVPAFAGRFASLPSYDVLGREYPAVYLVGLGQLAGLVLLSVVLLALAARLLSRGPEQRP